MLLFLKNKIVYFLTFNRIEEKGITMCQKHWLWGSIKEDEIKSEEELEKEEDEDDFFCETENADNGLYCMDLSGWDKASQDREDPEPRRLLSNFFAREEAAAARNDFLFY